MSSQTIISHLDCFWSWAQGEVLINCIGSIFSSYKVTMSLRPSSWTNIENNKLPTNVKWGRWWELEDRFLSDLSFSEMNTCCGCRCSISRAMVEPMIPAQSLPIFTLWRTKSKHYILYLTCHIVRVLFNGCTQAFKIIVNVWNTLNKPFGCELAC